MGYEVKISPIFIRTFYRRLIIAGFSKEEAGNLIAKLMGLAATEKGWTTKQLINMLFVEHEAKKNNYK